MAEETAQAEDEQAQAQEKTPQAPAQEEALELRSLTLASPAKLNLFLRVLGKRDDRYHEIVTLFHRISLHDTLRLEKRRDERIRLLCSHPRVPIKNNLMIRAFRLLKTQHRFSDGVTVRLTKRIPVGGGLGGGSSNAAAFLLGMNRLFRLGLTQKELLKLGRRLGADIPFFLTGSKHALGRGRGDEIKPLGLKRRLWFLLFPSDRGIPTAKVYAGLRMKKRRLTRVSDDVRIPSAQLFVNDLTESAERIRPSLKKTREKLSGLHLGSCQMSGSGPTLFIVFPSEEKARHAHRKICRRLHSSQPILLCHTF